MQVHRATSRDRTSSAAGDPGVHHPGRSNSAQCARCAGPPGEVVAGDVGEQLDAAAAAVVESDRTVSADGDGDLVGDRLPRHEVHHRRRRRGNAIGVGRHIPAGARTGHGDRDRHRGHTTSRHTAAPGHVQVHRPTSRDRTSSAPANAGVHHPGRGDSGERTRYGGPAGEVVAGDVGDQLDAVVAAVVQRDRTISAHSDGDLVRDRLPRHEVHHRRRRRGSAIGIGRHEPARARTGHGDRDRHRGHTTRRHPAAPGHMQVHRPTSRDWTPNAPANAGVHHPGRGDRPVAAGFAGCRLRAARIGYADLGDRRAPLALVQREFSTQPQLRRIGRVDGGTGVVTPPDVARFVFVGVDVGLPSAQHRRGADDTVGADRDRHY